MFQWFPEQRHRIPSWLQDVQFLKDSSRHVDHNEKLEQWSTELARSKANTCDLPDFMPFNNPAPNPSAAPSMKASLAQGDFAMVIKSREGSRVYRVITDEDVEA